MIQYDRLALCLRDYRVTVQLAPGAYSGSPTAVNASIGVAAAVVTRIPAENKLYTLES